jgi:hypothetical protein
MPNLKKYKFSETLSCYDHGSGNGAIYLIDLFDEHPQSLPGAAAEIG